jgi:DNA-binding response OmpR family regulator
VAAPALSDAWDAILLDISLPGMDGLMLCRKLRDEAHRDTPVLMLTARCARRQAERLEYGADDYLVSRSRSRRSVRVWTR